MNKYENLVMLGNYVLVRNLEAVDGKGETKLGNGIIVSANKKDVEKDVVFGEVVAVGEGLEREDGTIREILVDVDEIIIYEQIYGEKLVLEGETYYIIPDTTIFAVSRGE